jgi:ABC-type lipoprotein release transport system permease subunit
MLWRISWRNIWRNRSRSLVIIISVAIGLWAGIFLIAFYNGMIRQRIRNAIDKEISHVQLHHPRFGRDNDLQFHLGRADSLAGILRGNADVRQVSERIISYGMAATSAGSTGVRVNGVVATSEAALTGLSAKIVSGGYFTATGRQEVLVGWKLARKLKVGPGQKVVLTINDRYGDLSSGAFRVTGIFRTLSGPYDESNAFIRIGDADTLAMMQGHVNEVALLLADDRLVDSFAVHLRVAMPAVEVRTWMEISPEMQLLVVTTGRMLLVFMAIIMLALAFGIVNTMLMSVLERTREIGMLMSLGMDRTRIFGMILLETLFLVLAGCPVGISAALLTVYYTRRKGIDLSVFTDVLSSFGWDSRVVPSVTVGQLGMVLIFVTSTALLSAIFPARRAIRLKPTEAIRK